MIPGFEKFVNSGVDFWLKSDKKKSLTNYFFEIMEVINDNKCVAQGAAAWQEKETREQVMRDLESVHGYVDSYFQINGYVYVWAIQELPHTRAIEIAERGNHDEIMFMIHQYGKANCPPEKRSFLREIRNCILPEKVQVIIAQRNNPEEMNAYCSYQGFDKLAQGVILDRGDHSELMRYMERHGFDALHQRQLRKRGNAEEINLHIRKHGWADELLEEMFDGLGKGNQESLREYHTYISLRELPVKYQHRMLREVLTPEFQAYVDKYGLWKDTHADLAEYRLMSEVRYYLARHPYLDYGGASVLARKGTHEDKMFYLDCPYCDINGFLWAMFKVRPLDYEALTSCFLRISCPFDEKKEDIELMKNGSHEEVMKRIAVGKLGNRALTALFFRNNRKEFETYLDKWEK